MLAWHAVAVALKREERGGADSHRLFVGLVMGAGLWRHCAAQPCPIRAGPGSEVLFMADSVVPAALEVASVATRDWELQ